MYRYMSIFLGKSAIAFIRLLKGSPAPKIWTQIMLQNFRQKEPERRCIIGKRGLPSIHELFQQAASYLFYLQLMPPEYKINRHIPKKTKPVCSKVVATICIHKISTSKKPHYRPKIMIRIYIYAANPLIRKIKPYLSQIIIFIIIIKRLVT